MPPPPPQPEPKEGEEPLPPPEKKYKTKWIYEKWNKIVTSQEFYDIPGQLGAILKSSRQDSRSQKDRIKEARHQVMKAAEEKKALLA